MRIDYKPQKELPPLGERFEIRKETRFCVYRVGGTELIGIAKLEKDAQECKERLERNEWPWYLEPK